MAFIVFDAKAKVELDRRFGRTAFLIRHRRSEIYMRLPWPEQLLAAPPTTTVAAYAMLAGLWLWHDGLNECHEIVQKSPENLLSAALNLHRKASKTSPKVLSVQSVENDKSRDLKHLREMESTLAYWHAVMEFEPPIIGCVISGRDYSFNALRQTKECVIAIPTVELAKQVVGCGNCSGRNVDKFERFGLTAMPASKVAPPLIGECHVNLECKLIDATLIENYNFFILQVVQAWIDRAKKNPRTMHHLGHGSFMVAGKTIKLPSRMK